MSPSEHALYARHDLRAEECWDLLERVMASPRLKRATRMREVLLFVGRRSLMEGCHQIHEQEIGCEVFGRQPGYDTSADNIVRVNVTDLRKRIDLYFANEGEGEPVVFEIPRGSYIPVFQPRQSTLPNLVPEDTSFAQEIADATAPAASQSALQSTAKSSFTVRWFRDPLSICMLLTIVGLSTWLTVDARHIRQTQAKLYKWQSGPALRAFWGNFFGRGFPPEIVLADTSFLLAQEILQKRLTPAEYMDYSYHATESSETLSSDARQQERKDLAVIFSHSTGSTGDFRVARRITELQPGDDGTRLVFAREYAGHRLRWNNTIFVGSNRSNPWVELFEDRMAYHFKQTQDSTPFAVTVDKPTGTEQSQYAISSAPGARVSYCVIVSLPNPTGTGNILIVSGTDSQATEAGGDFMTSEENLEKLQATLHASTFPYFQVLLRISHFNGTPLGTEIISYRNVKN